MCSLFLNATFQGPVVQSVISLTSSLRVISFTVLADSIYNILIFFAEKMWVLSYSHFISKNFQHICVSLDVNFNESLTNNIVSFEQLGPDFYCQRQQSTSSGSWLLTEVCLHSVSISSINLQNLSQISLFSIFFFLFFFFFFFFFFLSHLIRTNRLL